MATISSAGIGSGLDVEDIISKLVALEKKPLDGLATKATQIQTKISSFADIKSQVSSLQDAASALALDSGWNTLSVKSSKDSAVSASITGIASTTSFSVGVQKLAQAQSTVSEAIAAGSSVGSGTLTLELGSWNAGVFTPGAASSVSVTVGATDNLAQIASKINGSGGGVVATVLSDSSGERLMLRSKETGAAAAFRITAAEDGGGVNDDDAGLSRLAFDLDAPTAYGMAANSYQAGQDAKATINGIEVTSSKNQLVGAVPGLTISLNETTTTDALITSTVDKTAITKSIQTFVDAYNKINTYLSDATKYDSATKTVGELQGDSTAVGLRNTLRSMLTGAGGSGGVYNTLSDIGITMGRDGNLTIAGAKLDTALNDLENVKKLFIQRNDDGTSIGVAARVKAGTTNLLSFDGLLNNKADALSGESSRNLTEQAKVERRADLAEARLRKTYTALDAQMGTLQALANYMDQQVAQWNNSNKK